MVYRIVVELQRSDMKQDRFHCLQDASDNHEPDARQKPPAICFLSYCRQDQPDDHQQIACAINDEYRKRILQKKGNDRHENDKRNRKHHIDLHCSFQAAFATRLIYYRDHKTADHKRHDSIQHKPKNFSDRIIKYNPMNDRTKNTDHKKQSQKYRPHASPDF